MFVPVGEAERQGGVVVRKPAVLPLPPPVHESDPVEHAAVGAVRTQQTVHKGLLEPAGARRSSRDEKAVLKHRRSAHRAPNTLQQPTRETEGNFWFYPENLFSTVRRGALQ